MAKTYPLDRLSRLDEMALERLDDDQERLAAEFPDRETDQREFRDDR